MKEPLKLLLTASGAPGGSTLIRRLRHNGERKVYIIGVDMDPEAIGAFWCDDFKQVPPVDDAGYVDALVDIVANERPDVLLPSSSFEIPHIARHRDVFERYGAAVLVSDLEHIALVQNKLHLYRRLVDIEGVRVPVHEAPDSLEDFVNTVKALGYPEREVCFKPQVGKGSRGFRILSEQFDRRDLLLNHKPTNVYMTLNEFIEIFNDDRPFPPLVLMEVVGGEELDCMTIAIDGRALLTTVKTRESQRWGVISRGELVDRPEICEAVRKIIQEIPLRYNIGLQFIDGYLIEINPRVSTFLYQDDLNEPYLAVKLALGEITPEQIEEMQSCVRYGRRMIRYMDQVFFTKGTRNCDPLPP